jgi:hypothetical protein
VLDRPSGVRDIQETEYSQRLVNSDQPYVWYQGTIRLAYLGRADIFPCASDTACLQTALSVDSPIPGSLDPFLDLEDGWKLVAKVFMALELGVDNIRKHHLNVPVATEPSCEVC